MAKRRFHWSTVFDCVMQETDENGDTLVEYTHEPGPFGPLLSENRSGAEWYHHYDSLGSTTMLTNDAGDVTDTFAYDAWGNQIARTGTTETPYTWVGRWGYQDDSATIGGYYIRANTYAPTIARWSSNDNDGNAFNHVSAVQRAVYIYLSPTAFIDPSGSKANSMASILALQINALPPISASFSMTNVELSVGLCGKFKWTTKWNIKIFPERFISLIDMFIVQKVCITPNITTCPNAARCDEDTPDEVLRNCRNKKDLFKRCQDKSCYYEAWRIWGGVISGTKIFDDTPAPNPTNQPGDLDTFAYFGCKNSCSDGCTSGTWNQTGTITLVPNVPDTYRQMKRWFRTGDQGVSQACNLATVCATKTVDNFFMPYFQRFTITKSAFRKWDCCCKSKTTKTDLCKCCNSKGYTFESSPPLWRDSDM